MRHAFYNLLKNSIEASYSSNNIEVKIINYETELKIHFRNKGKSIPQEIQPQIFDAFFSTKASGVGLGLTITKSIVEQHGGNIYLVRSDENGTEFVLTLPKS
ncbi:MAG: ATP-binding protein, partial [Candidatus Marinimicrobia bacterium]|nr:ATP-binding protein [Candidatus Neomarinimicrobiota bacterium]